MFRRAFTDAIATRPTFGAALNLAQFRQRNGLDGALGRTGGGGPGSIPLLGNQYVSYELIYATQPWIRAIVNRISQSIARLPLHVVETPNAQGDRERVREGALVDLLSRPVPGQPGIWLRHAIVHNLLIHENAIVVPGRIVDGVPTRLWPSPFWQWELVFHDDPSESSGESPVKWYVWRGPNNQRLVFYPEEVMHFHWYGGPHGMLPVSKLEALRRSLAIEDAATRMIVKAFEKGGRPPGALAIDPSAKPTPAYIQEMRAQLNETYGSLDNAYEILLLVGGAKFQPFSSSMVDMAIKDIREIDRIEAAATYNLPAQMVGAIQDAEYRLTELHLMEYKDTLHPPATLIEQTINAQLIDPYPVFGRVGVEHEWKVLLAADPQAEMKAALAACGRPFMTVNEVRRTQNLAPSDDPRADELDLAEEPAPPPPMVTEQPDRAAIEQPINVSVVNEAAQAGERRVRTTILRDADGRIVGKEEEVLSNG